MNARRLQQLVLVAAVLVTGAAHSGFPPPVGIDVPLPGTRIRLTDSAGPGGKRTYAALRAKEESVSAPDPRSTGATAYIGRVGTGEVTELALPASGWTGNGAAPTDFKFKSREGTIVAARLIGGRSVRFSAYGPGAYPLDGTPQGGVGVIVVVGDVRFCGFFGGAVTKDDGKKFLAVRAPAPAGCPVLGTTTSTSSSSSSTSSSTTTSSSSTTSTSATSTTIIGVRTVYTCDCTWREPGGEACGNTSGQGMGCGPTVECPDPDSVCRCDGLPPDCSGSALPTRTFECGAGGACVVGGEPEF